MTEALKAQLEKMTGSLETAAKGKEAAAAKEAEVKAKTKELLVQISDLDGKIAAVEVNDGAFAKKLEHGAVVQAEGKKKLEQLEKEITEAEGQLRGVDEKILSTEIDLQEGVAKREKEVKAKDVKHNAEALKVRKKLREEQQSLLSSVEDIVEDMEGEKDAVETAMRALHHCRLKKLETDAEEVEEVVEEKKGHAEEVQESYEEEVALRKRVEEAAGKLGVITKEYFKKMEVEVRIKKVEEELAGVERKGAEEVAGKRKVVGEYEMKVVEVQVGAKAKCLEGQAEVYKAEIDCTIKTMEKELEKLKSAKDMATIKESLAAETSTLSEEHHTAHQAASQTTTKRAAEVTKVATNLRTLHKKKQSLLESIEEETQAYQDARIEAKKTSAKLMIAAPHGKHTIPITPKPPKKQKTN